MTHQNTMRRIVQRGEEHRVLRDIENVRDDDYATT